MAGCRRRGEMPESKRSVKSPFRGERLSSHCPARRGRGSHRHRCTEGTVAITASTCSPQPRHVVFAHLEHEAVEHIANLQEHEGAASEKARRYGESW